MLSTLFAIGWVSILPDQTYATVFARLDGLVLGYAIADQFREDLDAAAASGTVNARAFIILFQSPVPQERLAEIEVLPMGATLAIQHVPHLRLDRYPPKRIFILGAPRSGTSQLGATLVETLGLPWTGEAHVAPTLKLAADALTGTADSPAVFANFLSRQNYRQLVVDAARRAYFMVHSSASFLDKTPGVAMVQSALFMQECFPDAYFIFLHRHPISNIVSRMARLGGDFTEHCMDWAATMLAWLEMEPMLLQSLVVEQGVMFASPGETAREIAAFLGVSEAASAIGDSLGSQRAEYTGTGGGALTLESVDWSQGDKETFERICGDIARNYGYML